MAIPYVKWYGFVVCFTYCLVMFNISSYLFCLNVEKNPLKMELHLTLENSRWRREKSGVRQQPKWFQIANQKTKGWRACISLDCIITCTHFLFECYLNIVHLIWTLLSPFEWRKKHRVGNMIQFFFSLFSPIFHCLYYDFSTQLNF